MNIGPVDDDAGHERALLRIEELWGAGPGTLDAAELEELVISVEAYEAAHHAILPPDPVEAIRFRMEQTGLARKD